MCHRNPVRKGPLPRFGQPDNRNRPKADIMALALNRETLNP